jgi:hypothetical protein
LLLRLHLAHILDPRKERQRVVVGREAGAEILDLLPLAAGRAQIGAVALDARFGAAAGVHSPGRAACPRHTRLPEAKLKRPRRLVDLALHVHLHTVRAAPHIGE